MYVCTYVYMYVYFPLEVRLLLRSPAKDGGVRGQSLVYIINVYVCIYMYICIYIYIYTQRCLHYILYKCVYTYMSTLCMCVYVYVYVYCVILIYSILWYSMYINL